MISTAGLTNAYRVLLGDDVIDDLKTSLELPKVREFIKLHASYDKIASKHPKSDPVTMIETDALPRFDSLEAYTKFLSRTSQKLSSMREAPAPELNKIIIAMLNVVDTGKKKQEATGCVVDPTRGLLGRTLPQVPLTMQNVEALPYSYPSFTRTLEIVQSFWHDKNYGERVNNELQRVVASSLRALAEHLKHTSATAPVTDLAVAAQTYLMDHNWIRFGLNDVAQASYALAYAGYDHDVTTDGDILMSSRCVVTYRFLGANLEAVLRKAVFNLAKETMNGVVLAGKQPAIDVVIACSSKIIQDHAKHWLLSLHTTFQEA